MHCKIFLHLLSSPSDSNSTVIPTKVAVVEENGILIVLLLYSLYKRTTAQILLFYKTQYE